MDLCKTCYSKVCVCNNYFDSWKIKDNKETEELDSKYMLMENTNRLFMILQQETISYMEVKAIVDSGVNLWDTNMFGKRPVELAKKLKRYDLVALLFDAEDNRKPVE